jgi:hypothetical protein
LGYRRERNLFVGLKERKRESEQASERVKERALFVGLKESERASERARERERLLT